MPLAEGSYSDWWLGLSVGFVVVVVVVIVVAVILSYAAKIGDQAGRAAGGLEDVRAGTAPLWEVRSTNNAAVAILEAARRARGAVVASVTGSARPTRPAVGHREASDAEPPSAAPATVAEPPGVLGHDSYPSKGRESTA